jgi:hypothetical protein
MTLYQKMLVFTQSWLLCALITWFLSKDRKRIRLLSAFLVGSTWPMSFPLRADLAFLKHASILNDEHSIPDTMTV